MATASIDSVSATVWKPRPGAAAPEEGSSPTFSIIVPTLARKTLPRTLASIASQIRPGDEIIVECSNDNDYGNRARQRGVEAARSTHLLFCDDDDIFLPGALDVMRHFAGEHPDALGIFRRRFNAGPPQWADPVLRPRNVQCMGFVIPNKRGQLGVWGPNPRGPGEREAHVAAGGRPWTDAHFISDTATLQDAQVIFCDAIIGHARPERNPVRKLRYRLAIRTRVRGLVRGGEPRPPGIEAELPPPPPN